MSSTATKSWSGPALQFKIIKECSKSRCRAAKLDLPHHTLETPTFMPVGTKGTMKGLLPEQVAEAGADIILGNTYHLGTKPGKEVFKAAGGLHQWMNWPRALLTDSGGFQMVSLLKLAKITEEGVTFKSPYDGSECVLTPEESIEIQNAIGADIMMQLDDVVDVRETNYERFKEATYRTTRWLDRCMAANQRPKEQNLFPIVQGGTYADLRELSLTQLLQRDAPGYAIGGLSGGEDKNKFWPTILQCTARLPVHKPRYCMGVGFAPDLVVCVTLGVDMFDCVYPTRTARFGCALVSNGQISLKHERYEKQFTPVDPDCTCFTCTTHTCAYIHALVTSRNPVGCHLLSIHNIAYQMRLMASIRESVKEDRFPDFVREFFNKYYGEEGAPSWVVSALAAVNISLRKSDCLISTECPSELGATSALPSPPLSSGAPQSTGQINVTCVADDNSDDDDGLWFEEDLDCDGCKESSLSGFARRAFDRGYREALRSDYPESEELGRSKGFSDAFRSVLRRKSVDVLAQTQDDVSVVEGLECEMISLAGEGKISSFLTKNPVYILSMLEGNLSMFLMKNHSKLTENQVREVLLIQDGIKKELGVLGSDHEKLIETRMNDEFQSTQITKDLENLTLQGQNSNEVTSFCAGTCTDGTSCVRSNSVHSTVNVSSKLDVEKKSDTSLEVGNYEAIRDLVSRANKLCSHFGWRVPEFENFFVGEV